MKAEIKRDLAYWVALALSDGAWHSVQWHCKDGEWSAWVDGRRVGLSR